MAILFDVQLSIGGELISEEILEESEVESFTAHFEQQGYEVRSERVWPNQGKSHD